MSHYESEAYPSATSTPAATSTLLALLLALKNLESHLNKNELAQLYEIGEQLKLDPDDWEFIYDGLKSIVESNTSLKEAFQSAYARVLDDDESVIRKDVISSLEIRGYVDNEQDLVSRAVIYITTRLLKSDDLQTTARNLNLPFSITDTDRDFRTISIIERR